MHKQGRQVTGKRQKGSRAKKHEWQVGPSLGRSAGSGRWAGSGGRVAGKRRKSSKAEKNKSTKLAAGDGHGGGDRAHLLMVPSPSKVSDNCSPDKCGVRAVRQE